MKVILALAEDRAICESLRASLPKTDLLLFEGSIEEGLRRLITIDADAIILDDAPHLGLDALHRLAEEAPEIPVAALSARGDPETKASYTMAGARVCIIKPFECEELGRALDECLGNRAETPPPPARGIALAQQPPAVAQHQMALRWMSRNTTHLEDPARLSQGLVDAVLDIFDSARATVLLQTNGSVRSVASHGLPQSVVHPLRLTFSSGLMRWLEENACLFDRRANPDAGDATKEMGILGARLAAPLFSGGRVCGAVTVGEKASGAGYTVEERDLLTVMARCASSCFEKARQYHDTSRQQNRLDTVLANLTAGVVTVSTDKTISMMNKSAESILQLRAHDVLGKSIQKLGSGFANCVLRTMADGKPCMRQQVRDVAINATLGLSVTPLGTEGAVAIFSVIPEEQAEIEDVTYSPIWEFLASRVAQEIKNPMVAINTFAQLLPRKHDSIDFREDFSKVVLSEVARINDVVEILFEFARHPRLAMQKSDLNLTVAHVLDTFDDELQKRSIKVKTAFGDSLADVNLDLPMFEKAVENVVRNSLEAMKEGGTLTVTTKDKDGACELIVSDTGPGIAEQDVPHVFSPFFSTKEQGMGLGLTLAGRIMAQHDGALELLNGNQEGGAFAFHFPQAEANGAHGS